MNEYLKLSISFILKFYLFNYTLVCIQMYTYFHRFITQIYNYCRLITSDCIITC